MPVSSPASTAAITLSESTALALANRLALHPLFEACAVDLKASGKGRLRLTMYLSEPPTAEFTAAMQALTEVIGAPRSARVKIDRLPETDWVAKSLEGLKPVRAGRFIVHGHHDRAILRPNDIAIEIEAGQAFGTGHHGTTAGCLMALDPIVRSRTVSNAADIGTGSGVLAIALAKVAPIPVLATDIDPVAVAVARENVSLNGVAARVATVVANGTGHSAFRKAGPFDLIFANILAGPLAKMAAPIASITAPGGHLVLSGLLPDQRRRILASYRNTGFRFMRSILVDGWLTIIMTRMPHTTRRALTRRGLTRRIDYAR